MAAFRDYTSLNAAQNALFALADILMESDKQSNVEKHTIRMLVNHTTSGFIIGKGGSIIKETQTNTGCNVKVLHATELPLCALGNDRVVQVGT